jgi:hypothetical protein
VCLFTCEDNLIEYPSLCNSASAKVLLCNGLNVECALTKGYEEALHPCPVCLMSLALIFYCGEAHKIEWKNRFHLALIFYHDRAHEVKWKQF